MPTSRGNRRSAGGPRLLGFIFIILGGLAITAAAALLGSWWRDRRLSSTPARPATTANAPAGGTEAPATAPASAPVALRLIDNEPLAAAATEAPYFAVVIDNIVEARPAAGLSAASVVYEAPVEAGITRFLAIFPSDAAVDQIGPVRSARPYFIDWASEYGALFAHVGGSPEALDILKNGTAVTDLNEFWNGARFWRSSDRHAPHNTYTSTTLLAAAASKGARALTLKPWLFKDDAAAADRPASGSLTVGAKDGDYAVRWEYDRAKNAYRRYQGGKVQDDAVSGQPIEAKNVVVQLTKVSILDEVGRRRIVTLGEGDAVIAVDGNAYHGTWRKTSNDGRTRFYDASGNEIRFNAGATWIEVVPEGTTISP